MGMAAAAPSETAASEALAAGQLTAQAEVVAVAAALQESEVLAAAAVAAAALEAEEPLPWADPDFAEEDLAADSKTEEVEWLAERQLEGGLLSDGASAPDSLELAATAAWGPPMLRGASASGQAERRQRLVVEDVVPDHLAAVKLRSCLDGVLLQEHQLSLVPVSMASLLKLCWRARTLALERWANSTLMLAVSRS